MMPSPVVGEGKGEGYPSSSLSPKGERTVGTKTLHENRR